MSKRDGQGTCTIPEERSNQKRAYNASGMYVLSQTWLQGPWPRSWHSPASSTQPTSRSVMLSSSWLCRCVAIMRARYATPEPANELGSDKAVGHNLPSECSNRVWEAQGQTYEVVPSCLMFLNRWNCFLDKVLNAQCWTHGITYVSINLDSV